MPLSVGLKIIIIIIIIIIIKLYLNGYKVVNVKLLEYVRNTSIVDWVFNNLGKYSI